MLDVTIIICSTDRVVVLMVRDTRSAHRSHQGRLHTHGQEKSSGHVCELRSRQGDIPVRRAAEKVPASAMPAADAVALT